MKEDVKGSEALKWALVSEVNEGPCLICQMQTPDFQSIVFESNDFTALVR